MLCSFFPPVLLAPVVEIVVFLMRQERPDKDPSLGLPSAYRLYVRNDGDQSIPILAEVKNHIALNRIGIRERGLYFRDIAPKHPLDDGLPCLDFIRRVLVSFRRFLQVLLGDDMHPSGALRRGEHS